MTEGENTELFRNQHRPWSDVDFYGMKLILDDWSKKGFVGELDRSSSESGYVTLTTRNWEASDGTYVMIELHKLKGKKVLLWQTTKWAARFFTCQSMHGAFPVMRGCIGAPTLIYALQYSSIEISHGIITSSKLEQYYN